MNCFIGVDVGSLTTKIVLIDMRKQVLFTRYRRNDGGPIQAVQEVFSALKQVPRPVAGVGTTGSGRNLAAVMIGADTVVNEITAHALAAREVEPEVNTVIDIGGQDSKIIYLQQGVSIGFNMNTVCAAGTGSFLDHQASRLNIPIEQFGYYALRAQNPVTIAGRCGVFAESDLIHKQQLGYLKEDLIAGLCLALAKNYLTNVARNRKIEPPVLFQGGVAANEGICWALEKMLSLKLIVPEHYQVMGALGAALLARQQFLSGESSSASFRGVGEISNSSYSPKGFTCSHCANSCEISELYINGELTSRWGSRCGKWESLTGVLTVN
ncbi:MAG TPA: 2-hydroxyglutaryl-CoA dehydratase [Firmicutes bacterium]|nr:2-hydroxyglutaryl-CoA dehydratase [Bacillota bacterium]